MFIAPSTLSHTPVSMILSAPVELNSLLTCPRPICPVCAPRNTRSKPEISNSRQQKGLNSYLFLRKSRKSGRYKKPCQMDTAALESKAGSNVRFLPVILLESGGAEERGCGRWRNGGEAVLQKAKYDWLFHQAAGEARRGDASPLLSSSDSLAHGPQEETSGKIRAPSLKHGKSMCISCVCVRDRGVCVCPYVAAYAVSYHCACSIIRGFSPHTMSEIHTMAAMQRKSQSSAVLMH